MPQCERGKGGNDDKVVAEKGGGEGVALRFFFQRTHFVSLTVKKNERNKY